MKFCTHKTIYIELEEKKKGGLKTLVNIDNEIPELFIFFTRFLDGHDSIIWMGISKRFLHELDSPTVTPELKFRSELFSEWRT